MQVHLLERRAMNRRLGLAQPVEQLLRAILPGPTQRRSVDQPVDVGQGPVHVMVPLFGARGCGSRFVDGVVMTCACS